MMKRIYPIIIMLLSCNFACAVEFSGIAPVNPLNSNAKLYNQEIEVPSFALKRATLTKNSVQNQYSIAMDKFMQSNIKPSYNDFRILIDSVTPNDYVYMNLVQEMASIGFFNLSELAMSKIQDRSVSELLQDDVKRYYFPSSFPNLKDQMYLAEIYSNIMYNDQSKEATEELKSQETLLLESDYANYLVAFGSMKNGDIKQAEKFINKAISKNNTNINYKRLKAEILSQSSNPKSGVDYLKKDVLSHKMNTVIFDKELHSSRNYILYKASKNDYWKKYYLAYYYYDKEEYGKALRTLQTAVSGKKNINRDVFALTAKVYYSMKEYEKAQDYALKSLDLDSSNVKSLIVLGDISFRNGDYKSAQTYYKKASSKSSDDAADIKLAKTYQCMNNISKAKEIYSKILKVSSDAYEVYYEMALLEKDREETYLKKAVAINPKFKDAWIDLARLAISKEDLDKALSFLNIAKYIDENDFRYYYYFGLVLKNKGMVAEANKNFNKSLNINPNYKPAKEELSI